MNINYYVSEKINLPQRSRKLKTLVCLSTDGLRVFIKRSRESEGGFFSTPISDEFATTAVTATTATATAAATAATSSTAAASWMTAAPRPRPPRLRGCSSWPVIGTETVT